MPAGETARSRSRAPRGEGDRLREQLLEAASELVREAGGTRGLSIRQVTKRAGVSPMALYLHFASREHLVAGLIDHGFTRFREVLHEAAADADGTPRARLRAFGLAYLRFARDEPALYAVIFGPHPESTDGEDCPSESDVGMDAFRDLVDVIRACQESGEARAGDPRAMALGVWSTMHGFATLRYAHDHDDLPWPQDAAFLDAMHEAWLA